MTQKNLAHFDRNLLETCERLEREDFKSACEMALEKEFGCSIIALLPKEILKRRKVKP